MSHHLVEFRDVHYEYPDGTAALRGLSLRITHGEAVGLVGANGAGKSTLLLHLNGCLMPTRGDVLVGDVPVMPLTVRGVRRTVGLLMQDPDDQLFMPTVAEDVAFGPLNLGLPAAVVEERVRESLETVGALHLRDRPPWRLSGGEKRAAAIAAVLAMGPDILVMDEPTASLDARARRHCIGLLKKFTHTRIVATHDLDLVLDVCPRTIVLDRGAIAADGESERIFRDSELLERCGLETPLSLRGR